MNQDMSRAERLSQMLRNNPQQPASAVFSAMELEAARVLARRGYAGPVPPQVTLQEATRWIAQAGRVELAQSIDVTDSIALKRGLATVALYVALNADAGANAPKHSSHA